MIKKFVAQALSRMSTPKQEPLTIKKTFFLDAREFLDIKQPIDVFYFKGETGNKKPFLFIRKGNYCRLVCTLEGFNLKGLPPLKEILIGAFTSYQAENKEIKIFTSYEPECEESL